MIKAKQEYQNDPSKELTREILQDVIIFNGQKDCLEINIFLRYYDVRQASGITTQTRFNIITSDF